MTVNRREVVLPAQDVDSLAEWIADGGGTGLARARELGPEETVAELERAGVRGRGGAGFPVATKWRTVRGAAGRHRYAVCNGAEGEPGTFKDRAILRANPYQVIEGLAIVAFVVGAREVFIALKASFGPERERVIAAVTEIEQAGLVGDLSIGVVAGPEEYLFGEEKALLEVIEGNDPLPRWLPPYVHGLFATAPQLGWQAHEPEAGHSRGHESNPTAVNNVETLANVAHVLANGASWYRSLGTAVVARERLFVRSSATSHGAASRKSSSARHCARSWQCSERRDRTPAIRAVLPGRDQRRAHRAQSSTVPLTFEAFAAAGSGLGAAGFIVYDDTACMVDVAAVLRDSCTSSRAASALRASSVPARSRVPSTTSRPGRGTDASLETHQPLARRRRRRQSLLLAVEEQQLVGQHPALVPRGLRDASSGRVHASTPSDRPEAR